MVDDSLESGNSRAAPGSFRRSTLILFILVFAGVGCVLIGVLQLFARSSKGSADNGDVVEIAESLTGNPGYCALGDTGVANDVIFNGQTILRGSKGGNYYCCGFTFDVVMHAAEKRGLLVNKTVDQLRQFQKEWYGRTPQSLQRQVVVAVENLGIGHRVAPLDAQAGDFINYWTGSTGHSVVFVSWIKEGDKIVGLKYRSSQSSTNGVGDQISYFTTSGYSTAAVIPEEFFVARLNASGGHL